MKIQRLKGTPEAVKLSYEKVWSGQEEEIRREIERDENLATILARLERLDLGVTKSDFWQRNSVANEPATAILGHHDADISENSRYFPTVSNRKYQVACGMHPYQLVASQVTGRTKAIVELGSGWSANLFCIYILLGRAYGSNIKFFGGEYTETGQRVAADLAAHDGKIDFASVPFDLTKPDLSFLREVEEGSEIIFLTMHAVEQVPSIGDDLLDEIEKYSGHAKVIQFEPIGWQRDDELRNRRLTDDTNYFRDLEKQWNDSIDSEKRQLANAAWWSWRHHYNHNMLETLHRWQAEERISIDEIEYDYEAKNFFNPSTMLAWQTT